MHVGQSNGLLVVTLTQTVVLSNDTWLIYMDYADR